MDFDLTDEQRLLRDSVDRLLADAYAAPAGRHAGRAEAAGWRASVWAGMAEMGLLGLPFAEADGGFGGGGIETMLVMEALGRNLAQEPYLATVVIGGGLLRIGGDAAQRARLLPKIADGSLLLALAHSERQARYDLADVAATARRDGDCYVLDGAKMAVLHGDGAAHLLVSARLSGDRRARDGISLFLVAADAPGLSRRGHATQDGLRAADVTLENVRTGDMIGAPGAALPLIERVVDIALAAVCAEAVGAMAALQALTLDYLKTRKQFGVALGSFQALQHRAADMLVALEQARSMAMYAAMMADEPDAAVRRPAIAAAKLQINQSARDVGQEAVQLHGGIAMTQDYAAGHYLKRLTMIRTLFGDDDHHLRLLVAAGGLPNDA